MINKKNYKPNVWSAGIILMCPGTRQIDGFAINVEPLAYLAETLFVNWTDATVTCRSNVEE